MKNSGSQRLNLHFFSSATDVSAAENIGRVLAQRCRECGIYNMILHMGDNNESSEKVSCMHWNVEYNFPTAVHFYSFCSTSDAQQ